jgi:hypothetical protein
MVGWVTPNTDLLLIEYEYASRMKTCQNCIYKANVYATRPSDVIIGKLINETATDWVTCGHLNLMIKVWWLNVQSSQYKQMRVLP